MSALEILFGLSCADYILSQDCEIEDFLENPSRDHICYKAMYILVDRDYANKKLYEAIAKKKIKEARNEKVR